MSITTDYSTLLAGSKSIQPATTREKEKLYEETIQLKTLVNSLRKELSSLKHENLRKEHEISKKDKVLEDIIVDSQNNYFGGISTPETMNKAKEANIIFKMKKQFKDLKKELNEKTEEAEKLKRLNKVTKLNEYNIEIKTLTEELNKLKSLYKHSLQENENMEGNLKEYQNLQDNFSKQHFIIVSLQESLNKANDDLNSKIEDINKLNIFIEEKSNIIKKTKKELQVSQMTAEKLMKEKRENTEVNNLRKQFEYQIQDLTREVNRFKDLADRKDRQVRELDSAMKKMTTETRSSKPNTFNYNDIKYIQENPEDKYDNLTLLLKSKLQEKVNEVNQLSKANKLLEKKLEFVEQQIGAKIKDDVVNIDEDSDLGGKFENNENIENNENNDQPEFITNNNYDLEKETKVENLELDYFDEDQLTEFTYILIKNFEAKKLSRNELDRVIQNIILETASNPKDLVKKLSTKVFQILKIKNEEELQKIQVFLNTILTISNNDPSIFSEKFLSLFDNVKVYSEEEKLYLSKKLRKNILSYASILMNQIKQIDMANSGYVTFLSFRKILESVSLRLKDKYIEFLIYTMKANDEYETSIYNLKYESMFSLIKNAPDDSKMDSSEELDDNYLENNDESEIVITTDQFNEKVNSFLKRLSDYLISSNKSVRDLFKGEIYKVKDIEVGDEFKNIRDDAVELKVFLNEIKSIGINLGSLDVYCIYTKLKIIDDYEAVSITILEQDLKNYLIGNKVSSPVRISKDTGKFYFNILDNEDNKQILPENMINLQQVNEDDEDYSKCSFEENANI